MIAYPNGGQWAPFS